MRSAIIRALVGAVGAVYSLDSGKLAWLPDGQVRMTGWLEPARESAQC